jgi:hypothetical protein
MDNPLTNKLGPLPTWAWAGIIVGGWWGIHLWQSRGDANAGPPVDSFSTPSDGSQLDLSANQSGDASGLVQSPSLPSNGSPSPTTIEAWAAIVADWLIGNGAPASVVQSAFAKYIAGGQLTAQEQALVNQGLGHFGTPPGGPVAPVGPSAPATPTSTLPAPPYRFMTTDSHYHSVPVIAGRWGLSSATVIKYNPEFAQNKYDVHHLPIGIPVRLPK